MTIKKVEFSICISVLENDYEYAKRLLSVQPAVDKEGWHRFVISINCCGDNFETPVACAIKHVDQYICALKPIKKLRSELWCCVYTDSEFAGIVIDPCIMNELGRLGTALYISVYSEESGAI